MQTRFPSISEYKASLERPAGLFRSIEIEEVCRDIYGEIELRSGNSAAVFRIRTKRLERPYNVPALLSQRQSSSDGCLPLSVAVRSALISQCRYYEQEMCVASLSDAKFRYYDVALSPWVAGRTLWQCIVSAARHNDKDELKRLALIFDGMCSQLLAEEWAHGDLKPENIIITPSSEARLIDYDAAYVPESGFDSTPK